jgi:FkbM family methyltransferase
MKLRSKIAETKEGLFLVLENDGIGGNLLRGETWEPHFAQTLEALPLEGTTVLDIGANIGANTVPLARAVGEQGTVIAFEPQRIPFQQLCGTAILNGFSNIVALRKAVGDSVGHVELERVDYFANQVNVGNAGLGRGGDIIEMTTIDSLALNGVSFIKLDIQGSETAAIRGARQTLETSRPFLFLEIEEGQLVQRGSSAQELVSEILSLGYDLLHINNQYPVDFVAIPHEKRHHTSAIQNSITSPTQLFQTPDISS